MTKKKLDSLKYLHHYIFEFWISNLITMITIFHIGATMILPKKSGAAMINDDHHDHQLQHCHDDDDPADEERCNDDQQ